MIASDVLAQTAVLLNDASQAVWTNTVLLPCLTKASEELERLLEANQITILDQVESPVVSVEVGDTELDEYPTDLIQPITLYERRLSSSDDWVEVTQVKKIDKNLDNESSVIEWCWRNLKIYINPPTTDREVYLDYTRSLTAVSVAGSTIEIRQSKTWLAVRTAQIAAANLGNNPTKAESLNGDLEEAKDLLLRTLVNNTSSVEGARRRPYRGARTSRIS
jgi:hypothetical protein